MVSENILFKNKEGKDVSGIIEYPDKKSKYPCVVIAHGLGSHKNYTPLKKLALDLTKNNFVTLRFTFTNDSGELKNIYDGNYLKDQEDEMNRAIEFARSLEFVDSERIGIAGHSFGGLVCLVISVNRDDIRAIATLASPSKSRSEMFRPDDIENIHIPIMAVHGEDDMVVHKIDAETIIQHANEPKSLKIIPKADHLFYEEEYYKPMSEAVIEWMKKNL